MKTVRIREKIKEYLAKNGKSNTTVLVDYINRTMKHGTTSNQLTNVLSKDKDIEKVGQTKRAGTLNAQTYDICVWDLKARTPKTEHGTT